MTTIFWQLIRTADSDRNHSVIDAAIKEASKFWSILDNHLKENKFILGEEISMADIPVGCAAYRWYHLEIKRPDLGNLDNWRQMLSNRHPYKSHVMLPLT
jgi:glutathione S-transferase